MKNQNVLGWKKGWLKLVLGLIVWIGTMSAVGLSVQAQQTAPSPAPSSKNLESSEKIVPANNYDQAVFDTAVELEAARKLIAGQKELIGELKTAIINEKEINSTLSNIIKEKELQLAGKDIQIENQKTVIKSYESSIKIRDEKIASQSLEIAKLKEKSSFKSQLKTFLLGSAVAIAIKLAFF